MEKLKHEGTCKEVHPKMSHEEWEDDQENLITGEEEELEELVDYDGSIVGSKVPLGWENVKTMSATKTMDNTIPMSRQSGEQGRGYFFKRFWGESVEEIDEHDMTDVLGYDDTVYMDAGETKDRAESMGKTKSLDKKSDEGESFQRLVEDDDIIKMLEVILKKKDENTDIQDTEDLEIPKYIDKKLRLIQKYARNHGVNMKSIINRLKNE